MDGFVGVEDGKGGLRLEWFCKDMITIVIIDNHEIVVAIA